MGVPTAQLFHSNSLLHIHTITHTRQLLLLCVCVGEAEPYMGHETRDGGTVSTSDKNQRDWLSDVHWNNRTTSLQKAVINALWQRFNRAAEGTVWARCQFAALCLFALWSLTIMSPWLTTVEKWLMGELIRRYIPSWIKHDMCYL